MIDMIYYECYTLLMTSMDGLIGEMERMGDQNPPRMSREHAKFLLVTLYGAILSLVHGHRDLLSISIACQLFEAFHRPRVKEAACLGVRQGEWLDEYVERKYQEFGEAAVLEATELQQEKDHAHGWMLTLRSSFMEVVEYPEQERTAQRVREVFLRKVNESNTFLVETFPKDSLHNLCELESTYHMLVNG